MQTFKEWLTEVHPEFLDEGIARSLIGKTNTAIGLMGILGRVYTPFVGTSSDLPAPQERPAMVAPAQNYKLPWGKVTVNSRGRKVANLTGIHPIDYLGSVVGEPWSQMNWDAADWIPSQDIDRRKEYERTLRHAHYGNNVVAKGPLEPVVHHTAPEDLRLTPRMRARLRKRR